MAAALAARTPAVAATRSVAARAADRPVWFPGAVPPAHLTAADLPGNRGFDPMCLGADPKALAWHRQAELVHCRWAMLGVAGILVQEIVKPDVFFYNAALPENIPKSLFFGGSTGKLNYGGLLAWEFLLMHFVEVRRWMDIKKHGSVNDDPIFKGNRVPNPEPGYPGGPFDPLGFAKGDFKTLQTKEIKNGRLAMVAFAGFIIQAQATGEGPLANLGAHLAAPFAQNWTHNIGTCKIPTSVEVEGITIPMTCLWPGRHV